jgi:hypothetical protein
MRNSSLPPSARVFYWWTIENKDGNKIVTPVKSIRFTDDRYSWKSLSSGNLTLYYYEHKQSTANELMAASIQALEKITEDTGVHLEQPVDIYIYASSEDLIGSLIFPREWTGGITFADYSVIAIGISSQDLDWGKDTLAHELGHMVTHQMTFSPYGVYLPTWLDEGLAMLVEGELDPNAQSYLKKATEEHNLISIRSLSSPFSAKSAEAYLSYAQSRSIIGFLVSNYGRDKISTLLNLLKKGYIIDEALTEVYGFDQDGLDQLWQESITTPTNQTEPLGHGAVYPSLIYSSAALYNSALAPSKI